MATMLEEKAAIRELFASYCFAIDRGQATAFAEMFTEAGIWDGGPLGRVEGRRALREFMAGVAAAETKFRHLVVNEIIVISGDTASARSYVLVLNATQSPPVPFFVAFFDDQLEKSGGRWLFKSRVVREKW